MKKRDEFVEVRQLVELRSYGYRRVPGCSGLHIDVPDDL
jgi:hypothetical protein